MFLAMSGIFAMFFFNTLYTQQVLGYGAARSRARVPALHVRDRGVRRARVAVRPTPRRPPRRGHGLPARRSWAPPADAAPGRRLLRHRPAAGADPLVTRDGRSLHATHPDRDDRAQGRRPGACLGLFNTSQQIGGALGLAVLSTLATSKANAAGGSQLEATVVGFHWAFGASAILMLVSLHRDARPAAEATRRPHRGAGCLRRARDARGIEPVRDGPAACGRPGLLAQVSLARPG